MLRNDNWENQKKTRKLSKNTWESSAGFANWKDKLGYEKGMWRYKRGKLEAIEAVSN